MARKLRLEYPGSIFRVMDRSDRREPIFRDDRDRQLILGSRREGDRQKVELTRGFRAETTMTLSWIAEKLNLGASGSRANLLRQSPLIHKYIIMRDRPLQK
jgi:hypothetical protein